MKNKIAIHRHGSRSTVALCKATEGRVCDLSDQGGAAAAPPKRKPALGRILPQFARPGRGGKSPDFVWGKQSVRLSAATQICRFPAYFGQKPVPTL